MKQNRKYTPGGLLVALGVVLLLAGGILMLLWQYHIHTSRQQAQVYVQTLRSVMPEPRSAVPESRRDNTMAALALDGADFVGILEMPAHDLSLPVGARWGNPASYPRCFSGSVYDGSLRIGATSQAGQYDFYRDISVGDAVFFTDLAGNRYSYAVTDIRYEAHADEAALSRKEADLTLFIKNIYALEYILVFCNAL